MTTIPIESDTRDKLRAEKVGNETYTEVIERMLQEIDELEQEVSELEEKSNDGSDT